MTEKHTPAEMVLLKEVNKIWDFFDRDNNGILDRKETYRFIREIVKG